MILVECLLGIMLLICPGREEYPTPMADIRDIESKLGALVAQGFLQQFPVLDIEDATSKVGALVVEGLEQARFLPLPQPGGVQFLPLPAPRETRRLIAALDSPRATLLAEIERTRLQGHRVSRQDIFPVPFTPRPLELVRRDTLYRAAGLPIPTGH